jgi:nitrite reductase (NO-forming)
MQRFGFLIIGLSVLGLLATTACSGGAASANSPASQTPVSAVAGPNGTQQVTLIVGNAMSFDSPAISVRAGQPVELTLTNTGGMPHDFSLSEGVAQPVKIAASGGETATVTFTIDKPGSYSFDCSMPGHSMAGMRGKITAL